MNESALKVIAELYPKYGVDLWEHVQFQAEGRDVWHDCDVPKDLDMFDKCTYRVKPNTHIVNGIECPAPLSELPEMGTDIYLLDPYAPDGIGCVTTSVTIGYANNLVRFGIWLNYEDAKANRDAHYPGFDQR